MPKIKNKENKKTSFLNVRVDPELKEEFLNALQNPKWNIQVGVAEALKDFIKKWSPKK